MSRKKPFLLARLQSFRYAFNGLIMLFREEPNARIHLLATVIVVLLGMYFNIFALEWVGIILSIGLVIAMEALNTALENLSDFVSPEKQSAIKKTKDLAAAAVLVSAITAFIIGVIIFLPKIIELLGSKEIL